jgi:GGDEF domain-containing protein
MSEAESGPESQLRKGIEAVRDLAQDPTDPFGEALRGSAEAIQQALDQFRQEQQLTISQFLSEITLLQKRIDSLEEAASTKELEDVLGRGETEAWIRSAKMQGSLLLLSARGIGQATAQYGEALGRQLTAEFVKRLRGSLWPEAFIGAWSAEEFVIATPAPKEEARRTARLITEQLSVSYTFILGMRSIGVPLEASVAVLDLNANEKAEITLHRIKLFLNG